MLRILSFCLFVSYIFATQSAEIVAQRLQSGHDIHKWKLQVEKNDSISGSEKQVLLDRVNPDNNSRAMGIEFETSDLKVKFAPPLQMGFKFFQHGEVAWFLEEDTFDSKSSASEYRNNLECCSIGGFKKLGIDSVASEMGAVLKEIAGQYVSPQPFPFSEERLAQALGSNVYVTKKDSNQQWFWIKLKEDKNLDITVRPQITYQIGLQYLEKIFRRVCELKSKPVEDFMVEIGFVLKRASATQGIGARITERLLAKSGNQENNETVSRKLIEKTKINQMKEFLDVIRTKYEQITTDNLK